MRILSLNKDTKNDLLESLLKRSPNHYGEYEGRVNEIVNAVREKKDAALFEYTEKFDGAKIDKNTILVTEEEIEEAYGLVEDRLLNVIRKSLVNIRKYHEKQLQNSWFTSEEGVILGQKVTPVDVAGVYVPGGKAVYPSSVLMNVLPANVAGVRKIV
jgi:histidinol dehydrogenase